MADPAPISPRGPGVRLAPERSLDPSAVAAVVAASRIALCNETGEPADADRPNWRVVDTAAFLEAVRVHRVTPLLAPIIRSLAAPDVIVAGVVDLERISLLRAMRMVVESARVADVVAKAGIPVLMIKGIALSVQTTGSPTARGGGDVDLVVRPADLGRAHRALMEAGWEGDPLHDDTSWWGWYLRMRRERSYVGEASQIDLHWRIGWHDQPLPDVDTLLSRSVEVVVGTTAVRTLSPSDAFAAACYHATVDRFARLRSIIDVVRLARRVDVALPTDSPWRLRRLVGEAVAFSDELIGGIPPQRRALLTPASGVDTARQQELWLRSSVSPGWTNAEIGLGEMLSVYRDSARFAGPSAAILMALTDGLLPPERLMSASGPLDVARTVGTEINDLVRRRLFVSRGEA